jgi:hypothetical protein
VSPGAAANWAATAANPPHVGTPTGTNPKVSLGPRYPQRWQPQFSVRSRLAEWLAGISPGHDVRLAEDDPGLSGRHRVTRNLVEVPMGTPFTARRDGPRTRSQAANALTDLTPTSFTPKGCTAGGACCWSTIGASRECLLRDVANLCFEPLIDTLIDVGRAVADSAIGSAGLVGLSPRLRSAPREVTSALFAYVLSRDFAKRSD